MMLVEQTTVPAEALPVSAFKDHLRLGSGFADDGFQDSVLDSYLRAAIATIEARTGKALIERAFTWTLTAWRSAECQALPIAPVSAVTELKLVDAALNETVLDPETYRLAIDMHAPTLRGRGRLLPHLPAGSAAEITFTAGFGADWSDIPPDLGQAVFLLGAHFYENRTALSQGERPMPFGVSLLIDRYRRVRLFGGAA